MTIQELIKEANRIEVATFDLGFESSKNPTESGAYNGSDAIVKLAKAFARAQVENLDCDHVVLYTGNSSKYTNSAQEKKETILTSLE